MIKRVVVEPFKTALFRDTTKTKVLVFVRLGFFLSLLYLWSTMHLVDFHFIHLTDVSLLQKKQNTWILTRQSSKNVAYKRGLDYISELFLPITFAQVISVLPEQFQKKFKLGELQVPPLSPPAKRQKHRWLK